MDFMTHFEYVEICNMGPEIEGITSWSVSHADGSWIKGFNAGGCRNDLESFATNSQFLMTLTDSDEDDDNMCTCVVSLIQKGTRQRKAVTDGNGCLVIGSMILLASFLGRKIYSLSNGTHKIPSYVDLILTRHS